ncbi:hypothetical protein BDC45DRAFT_427655, partial [Circinella umbellata]
HSQQEDCLFLSPTLADILSDDRILRFYQCVKDIKTQRSPMQTAAMFFALCHALGDNVVFLKVPHMSKVMFRQESQVYAVNVTGTTQQDHLFNTNPIPTPSTHSTNNNNNTNNEYDPFKMAAAASAATTTTKSSPRQLLQAALASVTSPAIPAVGGTGKRKNTNDNNKDGNKRPKKASPRDKEYSVRRNDIIQDLLKVPEHDLFHQANVVDDDVKLIIQSQPNATSMSSPLHRFATFANLPAHYDCDFAPRNAGVYFNYEYFQLFLAYRDLEIEKQQRQNDDTRPILVQCRSDIEKVLVNTNWEAIRRRLTIGERICQISSVLGRGFLLLSKQVSGRKLLHNFNTGEWAEFMREFQRPENHTLLQNLQTKFSPSRFYGTP